jgi:hypothetical protein
MGSQQYRRDGRTGRSRVAVCFHPGLPDHVRDFLRSRPNSGRILFPDVGMRVERSRRRGSKTRMRKTTPTRLRTRVKQQPAEARREMPGNCAAGCDGEGLAAGPSGSHMPGTSAISCGVRVEGRARTVFGPAECDATECFPAFACRDARLPISADCPLRGLIGSNGLAVIRGCFGRSFVDLDPGLHIAAGRARRGHRVRRGVVIWIAVEARERMRAHCRREEDARADGRRSA